MPLGLRVEHALGALGTQYCTRAVSGDPFPPTQPVDGDPCPHHRLRRSRRPWGRLASPGGAGHTFDAFLQLDATVAQGACI